jgi:two-component SAPR family response regulator
MNGGQDEASLLVAATCVTLAQCVSQVERDQYDEWTETPELLIRALGPGSVEQQGRALTSSDWTYSKSREMLFYLLCNPARTKEQIGLALWPDASTAQLHDNFRITLHFLRHALGRPEWVLYEGGVYAFNCSMPYWFDVEAFEFHLSVANMAPPGTIAPPAGADHLDRAISLYEGDFLDGTEAEWCIPRREELLRNYLQALVAWGSVLFEACEYVQASEVYRRAIAKDGYFEAAHRGLMRCLARQGELGQALRHYRSLAGFLQEEFDAPPDPETAALYERLRRGEPI